MSFFKKIFNLEEPLNKNIIITIDREHGTNCLEIAKEVAEALNLEIYDENIIELKALESNVNPNKITKEDSFLQGTIYDLYRENYSYSQEDINSNDAAFLAESKIIRDLAKKGNCIILGKCANYVLKENYNTLDIFIRADYEDRIANICKRNNVESEQAKSIVSKIDNRRKNHYSKYANGLWANSSNYDMCINLSRFRKEDISKLIIDASKIK